MKRLLHGLDDSLEEALLVLLLIAITATIFLQVIMRYLFTNSLSWVEEFSRYCFVWSGFLSLGYCVKKGKTLRVDILLYLLPEKAQKVVDALGKILETIFYVYAFYASFGVMQKAIANGQVTAAMEIPMCVIYAVIPFGFGLAIFRQLEAFAHALKKRRRK
ncbi:TRAP transporter small permease [Hominifimenecus sp. rT4P-3]|uniref:TRAP transporter small permease n=1 Tax=Hominifimenecus sp. rT4P-3 TaxID=3242979 RepID=UPI003DA3430F